MKTPDWAFPIPFRFNLLDRQWLAWKERESKLYFLEDDSGCHTGPFSDPKQVYDWVKEMRRVA